jgi:hypothetical protein
MNDGHRDFLRKIQGDVPGPRVSNLSHAFTVWWAHPLADLSPQIGVVRRLHQSSLGPLVDRSDRADNFAGGDSSV